MNQLQLFKDAHLEGEIKYGREIGKEPSRQYIWAKCVLCQKYRWVTLKNRKPVSTMCHFCGTSQSSKTRLTLKGQDAWNWKGGRTVRQGRYVYCLLQPQDSFFASMADAGGYCREHRLVMAKYLGRCLEPWEYVHHKNGEKQDNRIENLELTTNSTHIKDHPKGYRDGYRKGYLDGANVQIRELKQEIRLLRFELKNKLEV